MSVKNGWPDVVAQRPHTQDSSWRAELPRLLTVRTRKPYGLLAVRIRIELARDANRPTTAAAIEREDNGW